MSELVYYARTDFDSWQAQLSNYNNERSTWEQAVKDVELRNTERQAEYQAAHDAWEAIPPPRVDANGTELIEPTPPLAEPNPAAPIEPTPPEIRYTQRPVDGTEEIQTPHGPTIVMTPSVVVTSTTGEVFAMSPDDFERAYSAVSPKAFEV